MRCKLFHSFSIMSLRFMHVIACTSASSLFLENILLYTTFHWSVHQLINTWVVFTFWLRWVIMLWTCVHILLCRCMFSFHLGPYLGVELLTHSFSVFNILRNCLGVPKWQYCFALYSPKCCMRVLISPHNHHRSSLSIFIRAILVRSDCVCVCVTFIYKSF